MKVYLVGGAVRDQLLGLPVKERDWVVVGGTAEELKAQGYTQVGRDFPVFLHPQSREEYALARKERKSAPGYYGFDCDSSLNVSLEEDLSRRDLTINAMAMDEQGNLVDPYKGRDDLDNKLLRHVSPAFVEDPVRVLRIARFAARYYRLGFKVADETRLLMYKMVRSGELDHLVPERIWQEFYRSLQEPNPEVFIEVLRSCGALEIIMPEVNCLFGVPNPPQYHLEIDSGIHTLLVLQAAVKLSPDPLVRFGALAHDFGKGLTSMSMWPKHYNHEEKGIKPIEDFCQRLRIPAEYRKFAVLVARLHLNIHRLFELRASTVVKILEKADAFRRPQIFMNLLQACQADAMGCGRGNNTDYQQIEGWRLILNACQKVSVQQLVERGLQGHAIKEALHEQRVKCAQTMINSWKTYEK